MNEQQIRKIVDDEIKKKLFQLPKIPPHKHNGADNIRVNENDLLIGNKVVEWLTATPGDAVTNTLTITRGVVNPSVVQFHGIAYGGIQYTFTLIGQVYVFTVTSAHATAGAEYTNNGYTYTVTTTISGSTTLTTSGSNFPQSSGTLTKTFGTGDSTISFSSYTYPINASMGAVYSNNGNTFTVNSTITTGPTLVTNGIGAPLTNGTLNLVSGSGDSTILFSSFTENTSNIIYKAMITGTAYLGESVTLQPNANSGNSVQGSDNQVIPNTVQTNSSSFFDNSTGAWVPTVNADNLNLAALYITNGTIVGYIQVTSFTNNSVTIQAPLDSGWIIIGGLIIT